MSASADLQSAIVDTLGLPGALCVDVPLIARRTKEIAAEIEAASANHGLCIYVMPPLPTSALTNVPMVFFDKAEIRVRIIETPAINNTGFDAYDLIDDVATALQWQPQNGIEAATQSRMTAASVDHATALAWVQTQSQFAPLFALSAILAIPLQLAPKPVDSVEDRTTRVFDVIFTATYQVNPTQ
jgi:hypothetical protein